MKTKGFVLSGLLLLIFYPSFSQASFDKRFVNNCVVLNLIPSTSEKHDYKDVVLIAGLANDSIGRYSSIIVKKVSYKEKFGDFFPTDDINERLVALNSDNVIRVGRVQVQQASPQHLCIYPDCGAGSVWRESDSEKKTLYIPFAGDYVLVYNPSIAKNLFYMNDGSALEGSYASLDGTGRITEIYYSGSYSLSGFHYQVSYGENDKITSIEKIEMSKDRQGKLVKKVKSFVKLAWKGDDISSIIIGPDEYDSTEYQLEIKETNADGLWTKAILSHKDKNTVDGRFIDGEYRREFKKPTDTDGEADSEGVPSETISDEVYAYITEGVNFYNQAVAIQEKAFNETDESKYTVLVKQIEENLRSCIIPFEKAFIMTHDESIKKGISEYLMNVYKVLAVDDDQYQKAFEKYSNYYSGEN